MNLQDHTNLFPFETESEVGPCVDFLSGEIGKVLVDGELTAQQLRAIADELERK